jgi:hypothetical protein
VGLANPLLIFGVLTQTAPGVLRVLLNIPFFPAIPSKYLYFMHMGHVSAGGLVSQPFLGTQDSHAKEPVFPHLNLSEDVPVAPGERNNCDHWGTAQDEQNRVKAPEGAEQSPSADRLVPESQQISQRWGPQMLLDPTKIPMWTGF